MIARIVDLKLGLEGFVLGHSIGRVVEDGPHAEANGPIVQCSYGKGGNIHDQRVIRTGIGLVNPKISLLSIIILFLMILRLVLIIADGWIVKSSGKANKCREH